MYLNGRKNHLKMRDFRAHVKQHLQKTQPFSIGTSNDLRAIVCPVQLIPYSLPRARRAQFAKLKRDLIALLNELRTLN